MCTVSRSVLNRTNVVVTPPIIVGPVVDIVRMIAGARSFCLQTVTFFERGDSVMLSVGLVILTNSKSVVEQDS